MDIIKFINSRDIAEHLQKIKYEFSPAEAMLLIHKSRNISLKEKHEAYRELINLYPDYVVEQRRSEIETQPLSQFLTELMQRQNNLIEKCQKEGDKAFYFSAYFSKDDRAWVDERDYYNAVWETYQECLKDSVNEYAQKIKTTKKYIESCDYITLTLLPDGTILDVQCCEGADPYIDYFEWMWIKLPMPFNRGDILVEIKEHYWENRKVKDTIVVLDDLDCWGSKERKQQGFNDEKLRSGKGTYFQAIDSLIKRHEEYGDLTDMCYSGYFQCKSDLIYYETEFDYLDLEYYRGELKGEEEMLTAMSNFLKKKIDALMLAKAYHAHCLSMQLYDEMSQFKSCLLDEDLPLLGLTPRREK